MKTKLAISTAGVAQLSPARLPRAKSRGKRWENSYDNLRSAVGAALTRELFHFSVPTPRSLLALSAAEGAVLSGSFAFVGAALRRLLAFAFFVIPTGAARFFSSRRFVPRRAAQWRDRDNALTQSRSTSRPPFSSAPSLRLRIGVSLSSFNLSWGTN
jgi:hypothetical protein